MNPYQVLYQQQAKRLSARDKVFLIGRKLSFLNDQPVEYSILKYDNYMPNLKKNLNKRKRKYSISLSEIEEIQYYLKHSKYTISQNNKIKIAFDSVMNIFVVISVIESAYFLAFQDKNFFTNDILNFIWAMFLIDFFLPFFVQFQDPREKQVKNLKLISIRYAKRLMFPNLVAIIPLRFFGHTITEAVLRLTRIVRIRRAFKMIKIDKVSDYISDFFYPETSLNKKRLKLKIYIIWQIIQSILLMFLFTYLLACLWYYLVNYLRYRVKENDYFSVHFKLEEDNMTVRVMKSWYYIFTTLSTVGYGDFSATNKYEMSIAIVLLLSGPTWFAYMIANAVNITNTLNDLSGTNKNKKQLNQWLKTLKHRKELPPGIKEKIYEHYMFFWKNERLGDIFNPSQESNFNKDKSSDEFFSVLTEKLQNEILTYLFSDILHDFRYFFNSFENIKFELCRFLQPRFFEKESTIIKQDCFVNEIIFVSFGIVLVSVRGRDQKIDIHKFEKNCILGDFFASKNIHSTVECSAFSSVKGFALPVFAFLEMNKKYPSNIHLHLESLKENYSKLDSIIKNVQRKLSLNTNEDEEMAYLSSGVSKKTLVDKVGIDLLDTRDSINEEIEKTNRFLNMSDAKRKNLFGSLKEKFINYIESKRLTSF